MHERWVLSWREEGEEEEEERERERERKSKDREPAFLVSSFTVLFYGNLSVE